MILICSILLLGLQDATPLKRAPAVYWFPAKQGEERWLERLGNEELFDSWIADPKPNAATIAMARGKVKLLTPAKVDTKQNRKWRDVTISFVSGKISPSEWLKKTAALGETYHFVTSPKTPDLRSVTASLPSGINAYSARGVFAETLLIYWPGNPCFYSTDVWRTAYFPEDKQYESWILAMNDFLGPMLSLRADHPDFVSKKPKIVRADSKPGLLIFQHVIGKRTYTFYFNNGVEAIELPSSFHSDSAIMPRGLDLESSKPRLLGSGTALTIEPPE